MIPYKWADVVRFEDKFFRKEQILHYEVDGKVHIVANKVGEITEIRRTPKTKILRAEIAYLDDIFKVVRAFNPDIDGDGLKCSICGELNTSGYFIEEIKPKTFESEFETIILEGDLVATSRKESNFFVGYMCWKSSLRPKL